jgi:hypothetical protein
VVEHTEGGVHKKARLGSNEQAILEALPDVQAMDGAGAPVNEVVEKALDGISHDRSDKRKQGKLRSNLYRAIDTLAEKGLVSKEGGRVVLR